MPARLLAVSPTGTDETWFFTHDEISDWVADEFGLKMTNHRERIHEWAARSTPAWPKQTPTYLRFGYSAMLIKTGNWPLLAALATSAARQHLLLGSVGGAAASLTEIAAALDLH